MARFNPHAPAVVGLEWFPTFQAQFTADSVAKSIVQSLNQSTAQNIGAIRVYVPSSQTPTHAGIVVEIFDNDNGSITLPIQQSVFRPNQDVGGVGASGPGWRDELGSTTNIYTSINDSPEDLTKFIQAQCTINGGANGWLSNTYTGRFNIGVGNLAGERILGVDLEITGSKFASAAVDLLFEMRPSAGGVWSEFKRMANAPNWRTRTAPSLLHPFTFRPWLITEAEDFDVASEFTLRGFAHTRYSFIGVAEVYMNVYHVPETRLAFGGLEATSSTGWLEIANVVRPDGATWAKDGTGEHLYITRRIAAPLQAATGGGYVQTTPPKSFTVRTLTDGPPPEGSGHDVSIEPSFGTVLGMGDDNNLLYPLIQRTTAPADSIDSQPYVDLIGAHVYRDNVGNSNYARQEYSNHSTNNYGLVRFLVRRVGDPSALVMTIADVATDTDQGVIGFLASAGQSADPAILVFDDLPDVGDGWAVAEVYLLATASLPAIVYAGAPLVAGTQYYVNFDEFTLFSSGSGPDNYWEIGYLDTYGQGNIAGYGGTTDAASIDGGARDEDKELLAVLAIVPDAPTNFVAVTDTQELDGNCETCNVEGIEFGLLSWDQTALDAAFGYYEIQRSDDSQTSWQTIALIEDEEVTEFEDYEGRRVDEVCYRIRVFTSADIPSLWTDVSCTTYDPQNCEFIFTSNERPDLNLAYEPNQEKNYEFIDAEETVFQPIFGRDYQDAFQPTEERGFRLPIQLRVSCIETTGRGGIAQFDALRELATADIPYVTFMDMYGNRFYIHLDVPRGTHREPFASYVAEVIITQTQEFPDPVIIEDTLS